MTRLEETVVQIAALYSDERTHKFITSSQSTIVH